MGEETTIMGTVLSVVFQNEENGYAVLRLVTDDGELLTLVGCVPCAAPGENLTATGSFSSHPQYGEQFSASEVERYLPSNETEILNYLASGVVCGVGPATAEKLVARFGIETLQVLESEPEKLTAIGHDRPPRAGDLRGLQRADGPSPRDGISGALRSARRAQRAALPPLRRKRHGRARAQPVLTV